MGLIPIDRKMDVPAPKPRPMTTENDKGEVFWKGPGGHTWVFVPDNGERFPRITHGTYLLEYQHPDGRRVAVDLGLTEGIYDGFPNLCGDFLPRLGKDREWNSHERTVLDIMSIQLQSLRESFYAVVFDNGKKGLVYSKLSGKVFEVDLGTGSSRILDLDFSVSGHGAVGPMEEVIIQSDRKFFIQFENAFLTGALDDKSQFRSVFGKSLRVGKNIVLSIYNDIQFHHIWNMPFYEDMAWVNGVQQEVSYPINWQSFSIPCDGLTMVVEDNQLFAVNEHHVFEFIGFTHAVKHMRDVWPGADRNTNLFPEEGWNDLSVSIDLDLDLTTENVINDEDEEEIVELSELRFMSFLLGDRGYSGLYNDIIDALHRYEVIDRANYPLFTEDELKAKNPYSLLLWISDYDGIVNPMVIPDSEISTTQREALEALNGNYMESWFMSDVDVEDWLSALTLLVLTDNIGDVLEDMAEELEAEGIEVNVDALEKSIGNWTQYGIDLDNPESLNRRFTSVSIVQLAT